LKATPPPAGDRARIVDLVFAGEGRGRKRRLALGLAIAGGLYASAFGLLGIVGESPARWSADMAARIHDAIAVERTVELPPAPPPPPPATPPPATAPPAPRAPRPVAQARAPAARARAAAPAQAAAVVTANDDPVDLTGDVIVVGSGPVFAGGTTTAGGTSTRAVTGPLAPNGIGAAGTRGASLARPVSLEQSAWACPWPAEADALQVNEQTVVIKVTVRPDGRAADAQVLSDPGLGFGAAARSCALGTRFQPARNEEGRPIAAGSPPIRVHFFR